MLVIAPGPHGHGEVYLNNRAINDACIPFERLETFPKVAQTSRALAEEMRAKFPDAFE